MLFNMAIGEVIFGGVGVGLIGMLFYAIMTMFLAGLMIGRTPEIFGKKLEPFEMIMAVIGMLAPAVMVLILAGIAIIAARGPVQPEQRRAPWSLRDPLCLRISLRQQRICIRRAECEHRLLQPGNGPGNDGRKVCHHPARPWP